MPRMKKATTTKARTKRTDGKRAAGPAKRRTQQARAKSSSRTSRSGGRKTTGRATQGGAIFQALVADHRTVSEAIDEIKGILEKERAGQTDTTRCQKLFAQVYLDLTAHSKAEDRVVYSAALERVEESKLIFEAREEHAVVERLLEELARREEVDEVWAAKLMLLGEMVEHHVEEEEGEMFAEIRKAVDRAELDRLAEEFEQVKLAMREQLLKRGLNGEASGDRSLHS